MSLKNALAKNNKTFTQSSGSLPDSIANAYHPEVQELIEVWDELPEVIRTGLENKNLQITPGCLYSTIEPADAEKNLVIIPSQQNANPGYNNLGSGQAEFDNYVNAIMIEYSDAAAGAFVPATAVAALLTGEFEFRLNGQTVSKGAMQLFLRPDEQGVDSAKSKALILKLRKGKFVPKKQTLAFNITLKNGLPVAVADHQVRVSLLGLEFRPNSAQ